MNIFKKVKNVLSKKSGENNNKFLKEMLLIGIPVTLQSIFQAGYSLVDQFMVGKLGTTNIASSGLVSKLSNLIIFSISSIVAVSSILFSQYYGKKDKKNINKSLFYCFYFALTITLMFGVTAFIIPDEIISIYTKDTQIINVAVPYLKVIAISFIPMVISMMCSSLFRSIGKSKYPMYASTIAMFGNIFFNYLFIFGKFGCPKLGLVGAGIGTLISRFIEMGILLVYIFKCNGDEFELKVITIKDRMFCKKILKIVLPIFISDFLWSLGENIYTIIYGHLGTDALATMTLINPIVSLFIGVFTGVSSSALVMVGKRLGQNKNDEAYSLSCFLIKIGVFGSIAVSVIIAFIAKYYIKLFNVESNVSELTIYTLYAFSIVLFAKVSNMIVSSGILRSGGNTTISLKINIIGTWLIGIPLGIITAFVFKLPVYSVYFILSLEEIVRFFIGLVYFKKRTWMQNLTETKSKENVEDLGIA